MSACPVCGVGVKPDNLREHVTRVHPNAPVPEGPPGPARPARTAHRRLSRRREGLVYAVVAVVVLVALIVALFPWGPPGKAPAPAFSLTDTAGIPRSLQDYRGSWLLLDLMSTTCEWCQRLTQESLVPLYPAWSGRVQFLSVDINRQGDALPAGNARILAFKAQYGATWPLTIWDNTTVKGSWKFRARMRVVVAPG